ncbi:MAG: NADP-dependent malic enzyme [Pseudomonadota bacterium]|jgi:malate dehydrogenase (oxaloacetate-decarboxylating)(NADP+)|nr:NADP-dependent malic enzyme [Pseudomonadota bacterium]QKK04755.1 MAG: NADP-dependent malic enzyme [Pseudomonadota bacterium]
MNKDRLYQSALEYHMHPNGPGKITINPTKALVTARDLSLAYSPGVAAPCEEIAADPDKARDYTVRGNLVAVVTNGTAVLGLGDIGPLAAKPVMEGKAVLFKKFAGLDSIDIEIDEKDVDKLVDIIASLEPSFGGINLEDIAAPECFEVERRLRERMKIPVFHDDQHGTAIIVGAAFTNWLHLSGRDINDVKLVASGAGAASLACLNILVGLGLPRENVFVTDRAGVVYKGRNEGMDVYKAPYAQETDARTLAEVIKGADVFLGLSGPNVMNKSMVKSMNDAPLIMALANPVPEIMPEDVRAVSPDAVIATGRSDYPNQVNNVLCFPYIFRGALDVGATTINEEMKLACVNALARLTRAEVGAEVARVYNDETLEFGPEYIIPKPFDPRLVVELPMAVAQAAMDSGVATRPIKDFAAYRNHLRGYVFKSGQLMSPVYAKASDSPKRVVFAEGEEFRVLHATQTIVDDGMAFPILIGRESVILERIRRAGLRLKPGKDFELINNEFDPRYDEYWQTYYQLRARSGITPAIAKTHVRTRDTLIGALMLHKNEADAMICGTIGRYNAHFENIIHTVGLREGLTHAAALNVLIMPTGTYFICDAYVNPDPTAEEISEMVMLAVEQIRHFGITPRVALLSHSNFGSHDYPSAQKMRLAAKLIRDQNPDFEVDGEMAADTALSERIRDLIFPDCGLTETANLLVMPNIDAANISFNMLKVLSDAVVIGPLLLGTKKPAHILTPSVTARGIVNATAVATVGAQSQGSMVLETQKPAKPARKRKKA